MTTILLKAEGDSFLLTANNKNSQPFKISGTNELNVLNACDVFKDANADPAVSSGKPLLKIIVEYLFGYTGMKPWKTVLDGIKDSAELIEPPETQVVFERNRINVERLPQNIFFNEAGLGSDRLALDLNVSISIDTGAQKLDPGPGQGNFSFPKINDSITFDKSFMNLYGFPGDWLWKSTTTANKTYTWNITTPTPISEKVITGPINNFETYVQGNPTKNEALNNAANGNGMLGNIDLYKFVAYKELGDAMQSASYIAWNKYCSLTYRTAADIYAGEGYTNMDNNVKDKSVDKFLAYNTIMISNDETVHYRNKVLGFSSVLTSSTKSKPNEEIDKCNMGGIYVPLTDPIDRIKMLINMELILLQKNNRELLFRWNIAKIENRFFIFADNTEKKKPIQIDSNQLNTNIQELYEKINTICTNNARELENSASQNFDVNSIKNKITSYLLSPFIVLNFKKDTDIAGNDKYVKDGYFLQNIKNKFDNELSNIVNEINRLMETSTVKISSRIRTQTKGGKTKKHGKRKHVKKSKNNKNNKKNKIIKKFKGNKLSKMSGGTDEIVLSMNEKCIIYLLQTSFSASLELIYYLYCNVIWQLQQTKLMEFRRSTFSENNSYQQIVNAVQVTLTDLFIEVYPQNNQLSNVYLNINSVESSYENAFTTFFNIVQEDDDYAENVSKQTPMVSSRETNSWTSPYTQSTPNLFTKPMTNVTKSTRPNPKNVYAQTMSNRMQKKSTNTIKNRTMLLNQQRNVNATNPTNVKNQGSWFTPIHF